MRLQSNLPSRHVSARTNFSPPSALSTQSKKSASTTPYTEAEPFHMGSLTITEKALGSDHPNLATALSNLAGIYKAQGRYAEVEALYKRSLIIREKAFGPNQPSVVNTVDDLASLYKA